MINKHTRYCMSIYKNKFKNHAFLTFTASALHSLWRTMQTSPYSAKTLFCKNNNNIVLVELMLLISGNKNCQT